MDYGKIIQSISPTKAIDVKALHHTIIILHNRPTCGLGSLYSNSNATLKSFYNLTTHNFDNVHCLLSIEVCVQTLCWNAIAHNTLTS